MLNQTAAGPSFLNQPTAIPIPTNLTACLQDCLNITVMLGDVADLLQSKFDGPVPPRKPEETPTGLHALAFLLRSRLMEIRSTLEPLIQSL